MMIQVLQSSKMWQRQLLLFIWHSFYDVGRPSRPSLPSYERAGFWCMRTRLFLRATPLFSALRTTCSARISDKTKFVYFSTPYGGGFFFFRTNEKLSDLSELGVLYWSRQGWKEVADCPEAKKCPQNASRIPRFLRAKTTTTVRPRAHRGKEKRRGAISVVWKRYGADGWPFWD